MSELLTVTGLGAQPRLYLVSELLLGGARHPVGQQIGVVGGQQRGGGQPVLVDRVGSGGQPRQRGQDRDVQREDHGGGDDQRQDQRVHGSPPSLSRSSGGSGISTSSNPRLRHASTWRLSANPTTVLRSPRLRSMRQIRRSVVTTAASPASSPGTA